MFHCHYHGCITNCNIIDGMFIGSVKSEVDDTSNQIRVSSD